MHAPFPNLAFHEWYVDDFAHARLIMAIFDEDFSIDSPASWKQALQENLACLKKPENGPELDILAHILGGYARECADCGETEIIPAENLHKNQLFCFPCSLLRDRQEWARHLVDKTLPLPVDWETWQKLAGILAPVFPDQAITCLTFALEQNPDGAELYLERARLRARQDLKEEALEDLSRYLDLSPSPQAACQAGELLSDAGFDAPTILPFFYQAMERDPAYAPAWFAKGEFLLDKARDQALPWAEQTIQQFPQLPWGYILKANALQCQNQLDEALAAANRAVESNPPCRQALGIQAHVLKRQERFQEAIGAVSGMIALWPEWYWGNEYRQALWRDLEVQQGKYDWYDWGNYQDQQHLIAFNLYALPGFTEATLDSYSRQLETPDEDIWLLFLLRGLVHEAKGAWEDALCDYNLSQELNPRFPRTGYHRGLCLARLGHYPEALFCLAAFTAAEPYNPEGLRQLALCHLALGDKREACAALQQAVSLAPFHAGSHYTLAMTHLPEDPLQAEASLQAFHARLQRKQSEILQFTTAYKIQQTCFVTEAALALCQSLHKPEAGRQRLREMLEPRALDWLIQEPALAPLHNQARQFRQTPGGSHD